MSEILVLCKKFRIFVSLLYNCIC